LKVQVTDRALLTIPTHVGIRLLFAKKVTLPFAPANVAMTRICCLNVAVFPGGDNAKLIDVAT